MTADKEMQFLLYQAETEQVSVNAVIKDDNIWLTQKAMAALFGVQVPAVNKHLKNIFDEGELQEQMVISKMEITTEHGAIAGKMQHKDVKFYNLDAIISVGYRVNSKRVTNNKHQPIDSDFDKAVRKIVASDSDEGK